MRVTTVWIVLAVFAVAVLVGIVSTLGSARASAADPAAAVTDDTVSTPADTVSTSDDYQVNYSLDGSYAKFNLNLPGAQSGEIGFCLSPTDCIYTNG